MALLYTLHWYELQARASRDEESNFNSLNINSIFANTASKKSFNTKNHTT